MLARWVVPFFFERTRRLLGASRHSITVRIPNQRDYICGQQVAGEALHRTSALKHSVPAEPSERDRAPD
jgi:hypothetical protein